MPTLRHASMLLVALATAGCASGGAGAGTAAGGAASTSRPLAALATQRLIVAPAYRVVEGDPLGWAASIPRQREWLQSLDSALSAELGARGLARAWVYPPELERSHQHNPALSPDPSRLAVEAIRSVRGGVVGGQRVPDPLASQVRTLVAMHDARLVLVPVQVSFEPAPDGAGRAVLRLALLDGRTAEVRWAGDVRSDLSSAPTAQLVTSLAVRVADLITAP